MSGWHHFSKINVLEVCCMISKLVFSSSPQPSLQEEGHKGLAFSKLQKLLGLAI